MPKCCVKRTQHRSWGAREAETVWLVTCSGCAFWFRASDDWEEAIKASLKHLSRH